MRTIMLALAAALALGAARAEAAAYASLDSTPMWWGTAGDHADLLIYYDSSATQPVTLIGVYFADIDKSAVNQGILSCGQIGSGGAVIQPGGYCFVRAFRSSAAVFARIVGTDGTTSTANVLKFLHVGVELRDANDNTLQRDDAK